MAILLQSLCHFLCFIHPTILTRKESQERGLPLKYSKSPCDLFSSSKTGGVNVACQKPFPRRLAALGIKSMAKIDLASCKIHAFKLESCFRRRACLHTYIYLARAHSRKRVPRRRERRPYKKFASKCIKFQRPSTRRERLWLRTFRFGTLLSGREQTQKHSPERLARESFAFHKNLMLF
jgi:hypothetical protein